MKSKKPVTFKPTPKNTQKVISKYHTLLKQLETSTKRTEIEQELNDLGGLIAYQNASLKGERGRAGTASWLIKHLSLVFPTTADGSAAGGSAAGGSAADGSAADTTADTDSTTQATGKTTNSARGKVQRKLLDVGAISGKAYLKYNFIKPTSIDLNSQSLLVKQIDFFNFHQSGFDIVSLSLVVNFLPDANKRGQMLLKTRKHLKKGGVLFVVIPLPCLKNSRYFNKDKMDILLNGIGFRVVMYEESKRLAFYLCQMESGGGFDEFKMEKKLLAKELLKGGMNNFHITL